MKLDENVDSPNTITAYGDGHIEINHKKYTHSIIILPEREPIAWKVDGCLLRNYAMLSAQYFVLLTQYQAEFIIFGSGCLHRFPQPHILAPLSLSKIGIEIMTTHSACRTYNILVAESRQVLAALLIEK